MTTSRSNHARRRTRLARPLGWLVVASLAGAAFIGPVAGGVAAASVTPTPINSGNPTCSSFAPAGQTWTQFKLEDSKLANGTYSDGTLTVTISNYADSASSTPGHFNWSSNIGVDAVFVKAGSTKHNLYVYSPEATADTDLGPQAGKGNGISHISFCYDTDTTTTSTDTTSTDTTSTDTTSTDTTSTDTTSTDTTSTDTTSTDTTSTDTTSTDTTSTDTTSTGTESGISSSTTTSSSSDGAVLGVEGTPGVTPPPTDTATIAPAAVAQTDGLRIILGGLAVLLAVVLLLQPKGSASRR